MARVVDSPGCIPDTPPGQVLVCRPLAFPVCSSCFRFFATAAAAAAGVLFLAVLVAAAAPAAAAAVAAVDAGFGGRWR